jgi:c-di-GMP-related signal transduction protein
VEAVEPLPLTEEVAAALLRGEGPLGRVLTAVLRDEQGDWVGAEEALALPPGRMGEAYQEAVAWAEGLRNELG